MLSRVLETFEILCLLDIIVECCSVILNEVKNLFIFMALMFIEILHFVQDDTIR